MVPKPILVTDCRGGRDGVTHPLALKDNQVADAVNVDWFGATLARKRAGTTAPSLTGAPFSGNIAWLGRHVPGTDETAAELWGIDETAKVLGRLAGGTAWATPTMQDANTGTVAELVFTTGATMNGKYFIAYKSAQPRLHCWDGNTVRRAGLSTHTAAPTGANSGGAGTYAATVRYYRTRSTVQSGGVTIRRSEPSAVLTATPSGVNLSYTVTRPGAIGEGETHWELEASSDNLVFYLLATTVIGTVSYVDTTVVTAYSAGTVSAALGTYTVQKAYRFIAGDANHMLGFGSYTSTDMQNRLEISSPTGSLNISDEERVPLTNYIDFDEPNSGPPMGLCGPVNGSFFVFKYRQVWKLTPTGSPSVPYQPYSISKTVGAVGPHAICVGEDEMGNAAIYWMSSVGPYRYGANGVEYIGSRVEDRILASSPNSATVINLAATVVSHMRWVEGKRQVWMWFTTASNSYPDSLLVFQVGHVGTASESSMPGGWSRYTGNITLAECSVTYANTIGATMSRDLKPYIGQTGAVNRIWKCDSGTDDAGTTYAGSITTKAYAPWGLGMNGTIGLGSLFAKVASATTLQLTTIRDWSLESQTSTASVAGSGGSETRVQVAWPQQTIGECGVVQFTVGDAAATTAAWTLDLMQIDWVPQEKRAA